jgi:GT2 family glycosyltransferase
MRISVVIPTYQRPDRLRRGLTALWNQQRTPDEVCVVVRPEDAETRAVVEAAASQRRPVRVVDVHGPGLVAALNAGLALVTGDVVAFTDDDTEPHPDWLRRIAATLEANADVAGVGGRDWVRYDGHLIDGVARRVGIVTWYGRTIGNHHIGAGEARKVDVLKGANMAFRTAALREVGFDRRLLAVGTEHHSELMTCLTLRAGGWEIVYDPAIGVDHNPAARAEGRRNLVEREIVRAAIHNETLALVEYLPLWRRAAYFAWALGMGSVAAPGIGQLARALVRQGEWQGAIAVAALQGRAAAFATRRRSRAGVAGAVLAIGHSGYGAERAAQLVGCRVVHAAGGWRGVRRAVGAALRADERVLYLVDVGMSTTAAAVAGRLRRRRVVLDTGDVAYELARSVGGRSRLGIAAVRLGERIALRSAHHVIVRGRGHAALVGAPSTHVPDVAPPTASPRDGAPIRARLGLEGCFVAGLVGSLNYSPRLGRGYGWDLVEALASTPDDLAALIVGDGPGMERLQRRAAELRVTERCRFVGRIDSAEVADYIAAMDAGISTQTNDVVGAVRTTGKLPLYLACGLPVLASHVGEAARLLGPLGWTLPYEGVVDEAYPERLAGALARWARDPGGHVARRAQALELSRRCFDPVELGERLRSAISGA